MAAEIGAERSLEYIPPFDDVRIIAGQGTVGLEVARSLADVATIVVCVGGGGLISGIATAVKALLPGEGHRGRAGARRRRAGVTPRGPDRQLARGGRDEDDLRRRSHPGSRRADVRDHLCARRRDRDRAGRGRARGDALAGSRGEAPRRADGRARARGGADRGRHERGADRSRRVGRERRRRSGGSGSGRASGSLAGEGD